MNNTASISNPLSQNYGAPVSPGFSLNPVSSTSTSTSSNSFSNLFSNFDWRVWLFIIFILAFLGINIFVYLAKGTQTITDIFAPIVSLFGGAAVSATKQVATVSATGAQSALDIAGGTVIGAAEGAAKGAASGLDAAQQNANNGVNGASANTSSPNAQQVSSPSTSSNQTNNSLNAALNSATSSLNQTGGKMQEDIPTYEADDSYSSIQSSKTAGKAGWCYIGEDRGFRSCIQVGDNDQCMSGDIFPTQEVCVNPNLRS